MTAHWKDTGRGTCLLAIRRFKSFRCFLVAAVILNLLLFASLTWKSAAPRTPDSQGLLDHHHVELVQNLDDSSPEITEAKDRAVAPGQTGSHPKESGQKSACSYRTAVYLNNRHIDLNQQPFLHYVQSMSCLNDGSIAAFHEKFVRFSDMVVDAGHISSTRRGGEKMDQVWNQNEMEEYLKLTPGFFKASCKERPKLSFLPIDHLKDWIGALECYSFNTTNLSLLPKVAGTTLAIQRYEYVNLYHTMTDFYNAFVLMLIFGVPPPKLNILVVDAHPEGTLDPVWMALFGKFLRAGQLERPTVFQNLVWGLLGYSSPLNEHDRQEVPYLPEFREFFLSRHNISTQHVIDCRKLNVLFIWRRDYVAHPRNPAGSVVRKFENEDEMVAVAKETLGPGANVVGMQLDNISMTDQLRVVAQTDILVGMHGAGLSHILFLPATSGVVEYKPEYSNPALQHFSAMARWRSLPYTIWHNFDAHNERPAHKTYIPRTVVQETMTTIQKKICS